MLKRFLTTVTILIVSAANAGAPVVSAKPATETVTLTKDNMIVMNNYYDGETVAKVTQKAKQLDSKLKGNDPIYLVIDSGGGSIDAGIELIENLNNLNRPVHTLSLFAASMGFQTVQGINGKRLLTADGTLMSHKARGWFGGEFPGQLDSRYAYYLKRIQRLDERAAARTNGKLTVKAYQSLIENEYWCDGRDCVKQGFADAVISPKCGDSLNGTHNVLYDRFLYMGHIVEIVDTFSDCPLITAPLSWQVYIDGEPLFEQFKDKATVSNTYSYTRTILAEIGLETAENIKKMVTKKMDARTSAHPREVKKY